MDRGAWQATVHGLQRVGHDWGLLSSKRWNYFAHIIRKIRLTGDQYMLAFPTLVFIFLYVKKTYPNKYHSKWLRRNQWNLQKNFPSETKLSKDKIFLCLLYLLHLTSLQLLSTTFGVCFHHCCASVFRAHLLPGQSHSLNASGCSHICRIYSFDSPWLPYLQFWLPTSLLNSRHNFYLLICHLHLDFYFAFSTSKTELIFHPNMFLFLFLPTLLIILSSQVRSSKFVI